METNKRIHPLIAAAAIGVLLLSLTGVAAMTGLLPTSHSTPNPQTALSAPSATSDESKSAANDNASEPATSPSDSIPKHKAPTHSASHSYAMQEQTASICHSCGTVESVQAVQHQAKPSGLGIAAGAVVGGLLGNQVGAGNGRALSTVAGAVGGGFAGNEIEKRTHTTTTYEVHVRMEDGQIRTFPQSSQNGWRVGDHVKVVNGALTERG
jgi:outer membrane lipoprotein SlyB